MAEKVLYIRVDESISAAVLQAATDDHRSVTAYVATLIEGHLRSQGYLS